MLFNIIILLTFSLTVVKCDSNKFYTNDIAVTLRQDKCDDSSAQSLADRHGFELIGQIGSIDCHYLLRSHRISIRSSEYSRSHQSILSEDQDVLRVEQQYVNSRVKRHSFYVDITESDYHYMNYRSKRAVIEEVSDPLWPEQWYLNRGQGLDMNVQIVWNQNITGKGVVVAILDDGLERDHPDIVANYEPMASYDFIDNDPDPMPRYDKENTNHHGTRNAGVVAAMANNICARGIAFNAKVGGVRMLDGTVTDATEARSLGLKPQIIDIYSASWGPDDDGKTVDGPGVLASRALINGVTKGRNGLGSIFVWASGIGGRYHDNCNCDGYTNSILTISVSSATENGKVPWYSEACSSTLATTYSSGNTATDRKVVTTDLHGQCTYKHSGTSPSAPMAAAIFALALEANPRLTWRDMQHLVVKTANSEVLHADDWITNGMGRRVSHHYGYGLIDAGALVEMAKDWVTVPIQRICSVKSLNVDKRVPPNDYIELSLKVSCDSITLLEHVQVKLSINASRRGDLHIYLTSPAGTRSTLLTQRPSDNSSDGFRNWPFMTVHSWGENPNGEWKLQIHHGGKYYRQAMLKEWTLVLLGTSDRSDPKSDNKFMPNEFICEEDMDCKIIDENSDCLNGRCVCGQNFVNDLNELKCSEGMPEEIEDNLIYDNYLWYLLAFICVSLILGLYCGFKRRRFSYVRANVV